MSTQLIADLTAAAARVFDARTTRALRRAVIGYERVLGGIPDEPANSVSAGQARAIGALTEDVIDLIEARVADTADDRQAQPLATAVYELRRLLEEIGTWRHHYMVARPS